jgi:4'-phosphopantetheinyl transferase
METYWFEQCYDDVPHTDDWLSEAELACFSRLRIAKRRADWRLGRWTAKRGFAQVLDLPFSHSALSSITITATASGAPTVTIACRLQPVTISVSHRNGRAVCALALGSIALGCDIEVVEAKSAAFVADYFTSEEQDLIARSTQDLHPLLASLLWSAKESALKALQVGLRADTRSVAVDTYALEGRLSSNYEWHNLTVRSADAGEFHGWWRREDNVLHTVVAQPRPRRPIDLLVLIQKA